MIYLSGLNAVSTLGTTQTQVLATLSHQGPSKLVTESGFLPDNAVATLGHVPLPNVKGELRNLTLIKRCLDNMAQVLETVKKEVSPDRIGIVIGTSTSALTDVELEGQITETGTMKFDPRVYEIGIISEYVRKLIGGRGPSYTVATACSSSARAILSARNLILSGLCDAVIAGGTDSLSQVTVSGFHALGALDPKPARPFASDRAGINIGEGAGLCVVANRPLAPQAIKLLGGGASTDAYHVSAPDPTASGALLAVQAALQDAGLEPKDIGYINMHGTGTNLNDAMEGTLVREIFGNAVPVSSLKHLTGHTLGAAGIVEVAACGLMLASHLPLPFHPYHDKAIYADEFGDLDLVVTPNRPLVKDIIMTNNFAFGGNNTSLILGC